MDEQNADKEAPKTNLLEQLSSGHARWLPGSLGGLVSAIATVLFIVIPVVNTWLANAKEIQLAQIKNTAEQVAYISQRMGDAEKERDLYRQEMLKAQQEERHCIQELAKYRKQNGNQS